MPLDSRLATALVAACACLGAAGCGEDDSGSDTNTAGGSGAPAEAPAEQGPTVDAARVERAVKKELDGMELIALPVPVYPQGGGPPEQSQIGGGRLKVREVTCPPDVPLERGGTFTCEVDGGDTDGEVRLTLLNADGTSLRYKASVEGDTGEGISSTTEVKGKLRLR